MMGAIFMKFGLAPTTWTKRMRAEARPSVSPTQSLHSLGVPIGLDAAMFE